MSDPYLRASSLIGVKPARKLAALYLSECVDALGYLRLDAGMIDRAAEWACTTASEVEAAVKMMRAAGILAGSGVELDGREVLFSPDRHRVFPPQFPHSLMVRYYVGLERQVVA